MARSVARLGGESFHEVAHRRLGQIAKFAGIEEAPVTSRTTLEPDVRLLEIDHADQLAVWADRALDPDDLVELCTDFRAAAIDFSGLCLQVLVAEHLEPHALAIDAAVDHALRRWHLLHAALAFGTLHVGTPVQHLGLESGF